MHLLKGLGSSTCNILVVLKVRFIYTFKRGAIYFYLIECDLLILKDVQYSKLELAITVP
jgi:hypothetical protein